MHQAPKWKKRGKEKEAGITQVYQHAAIGNSDGKVNESIKEITHQSSLTITIIQNLHLQALDAEHGEPPQPVNHLLGDNPYVLCYGEKWKDEIKKTTHLSLHIWVTELVTHIMNETKLAYKGTKYEDTYLFYHNALWQMTDNTTIKQMQKEGILHWWIRPVLGLQSAYLWGSCHQCR